MNLLCKKKGAYLHIFMINANVTLINMNEEEVLQDMFVKRQEGGLLQKGVINCQKAIFFNVETYCEQKGVTWTQEVFLSFALKSLSLPFCQNWWSSLEIAVEFKFFSMILLWLRNNNCIYWIIKKASWRTIVKIEKLQHFFCT